MEKEDHLSNEISVSAEVVDNSIKASAKSRALSGIDRLVGSSVDFFSAKIEALTEKRREKTQGEVAIIRKAAEFGIQEMHIDHEFSKRAFETHFKGILREQENKDAVVANALQDLSSNPMAEEAMNAGPKELSEDFLGRFEDYAKGASTDELRERWGRVLAGEIRKPGTFNKKVLRAIDELDSDVAKLFEELSAYGFGNILFRSLVRNTSYTERVKLFGAGIFTSTADDQLRAFSKMTQSNGEEVWCFIISEYGVGFRTNLEINYKNEIGLKNNNGEPCFATYLLSDVGEALLKLINNDEREVAKFVFEKLKSVIPEESLYLYQIDHKSGYAKRIYDF
ncbi:DUF2806 domain-containing protein [Paenochrobactrum sp. BZR 201-1]